MVDQTIFDLGQEGVLTPEHRFVVQENSAADIAQSATFALMGGLQPEAITPTTDIIGEVGKLYVVTTTSMSSNIDFVVPAAGPGARIGIYCNTDEPDWVVVIKGDISVVINGGASNTEWSRLFINGETVVLLCVAVNTWIVEIDGRIPCEFLANMTADMTFSTANLWAKVDFDSEQSDIGNVYDPTTNQRMTARRAAWWEFSGDFRSFDTSMTVNEYYNGELRINGTTSIYYSKDDVSADLTHALGSFSRGIAVAESDYFEVWFRSNASNAGVSADLGAGVQNMKSFFTGREVFR